MANLGLASNILIDLIGPKTLNVANKSSWENSAIKIVKIQLKYNFTVPDWDHFLSSSSFIQVQTVEFEHVSSLNFAQVFGVLAWVIPVF